MIGSCRIVGITGRSGSGKSSVTRYYASKGYATADGDAISHEVMSPGSPCVMELTQAFGKGILCEGNTLDRKRLGQLAFATPEGNKKLISITHPYILQRFLDMVKAAEEKGHRLFFLDGAMIADSIFEELCDDIIVVTAPLRLSVSRIVLRDGISKTAAMHRLSAQPEEAYLLQKATYAIYNDESEALLYQKADAVLEKIKSE